MSKASEANQLHWDIGEHLKNDRMCEAFLSVAESRYPDLLANVRVCIARAMSGWMIQDGFRAEVRWSDEDGCFVGRLRGVREEVVSFRGGTPNEMQKVFAKAVENFIMGVTQKEIKERPEVQTQSSSDNSVDNVVTMKPRKGCSRRYRH